ncbi:MAG TPA: hypothetical protein VFI95_21765, partial [Terriglobales bacterium]|nr:hypothetical protein [Terriglobales bacterium]
MSALLNSDQQSTYAQRFTGFLHVHISEAWKRFLLAFAGLVLAFAAAVFSRVSRDSGDLWATVILASVALLLATIVGLTTVPYLARRVAVPRVRDAFDYDVTRIGVVYILTALVIGIAALNTGNNLLYIIVAVMLASILISGIASSMTLRAMKLDIHVPEHVFCSRAAMVRIVLQNQYRYFPCFSVVVAPAKLNKARKQWRLEETIFSFPGGRPAGKQWFHLPDRVLRRVAPTATLPPVFRESIYFPLVATSSEASADLAVRFERRGRFRQDSFTLSTGFPFAFLTKKRRVSLQREILV